MDKQTSLVYEDKLKRAEQNIWDTSMQCNKTFLFPNAMEYDIFVKQKCAYKAKVQHVWDDDDQA